MDCGTYGRQSVDGVLSGWHGSVGVSGNCLSMLCRGNGLCRCGEACVDQASRRHAVAAPPRNDSGCLSPPANPSEFINVLEAALSGTFRFVLLRQFLIPLRTLSL